MEPRSRSWALGLSIVGLFGLLFSAGFVQQVAADDVADYGTVIGIVSTSYPGLCELAPMLTKLLSGSGYHLLVSSSSEPRPPTACAALPTDIRGATIRCARQLREYNG